MSERQTLCVVGLGLIGGSVAASLKAKASRWTVRGADRRRSSLSYALNRGIIDEAADSLRAGVEGADLVLLAAPVSAIRDLLTSVSGFLRPGQIVTDVGSTKTTIVETAQRALPEGVSFVGGHPVAGTERSGVEGSVAGLFEGRTCVLTPGPETDRGALEVLTEFWRGLGAEVIYLSPQNHDRIFALVSHLPHMVAFGLMNTVGTELPPNETALGGSALRDFTRIARGSPALWSEICVENRAALTEAIDVFGARLEALRGVISRGDQKALREFFESSGEVRAAPWTL